MKALPMVKNVWTCLCVSFFQLPISRNLSNTSINTDTAYANLINTNPLKNLQINN